ncbi:MAG: diacylglycerol/lipid kinase family protein [bacterium]
MVPVLPALEYQFERIFRRTMLFPAEHLTVDVVVNLQAGSLSSEKRAVATVEALNRLTSGIVGPERPDGSLAMRFHVTHYVGHAREISCDLVSRCTPGVHLILSLGGDGTHGDVLSAYESSTWSSSSRRFFVRLPMGTGNDGADARDLPSMVRLLLGSAEERRAARLVVKPSRMSTFRGFNIASVGLDAYVAYLTNRLKGRFGGDLYKVIADVMTLLYERVVGADPMVVSCLSEEGSPDELAGRFMLVAFGVSGYRQYGGGKVVLPGYENVCAIERLGLLGKVRLKSLFYRGEHIHESNVHMRSAKRITIEYGRSIPLQIDGETVWLEKHNFPLEMHVLPPEVPVLSYAGRLP